MHIGTLGELALIAVVALIVIGPKDLPQALRALGRLWQKLHLFVFKTQRFFQALASEADLQDILASHKQVESSDTPASSKERGIKKRQKALPPSQTLSSQRDQDK